MGKGVAKFMFKVYDTEAKEYISLGYKPKSSWLKFPSAALAYTYRDLSKLEVHKFEIVHQMVAKLDSDGRAV